VPLLKGVLHKKQFPKARALLELTIVNYLAEGMDGGACQQGNAEAAGPEQERIRKRPKILIPLLR
jgi:hypothetical protein